MASLQVAFRRHSELPRVCRRRLPQHHRHHHPRRHQHQQHRPSGPTSEGAAAKKEGASEAKATAVEDPIPISNTVAPLPFWQRLGPLTRAGQAYARAQRRRPWATQLASTLVIYLCADASAQHMGGGDEYDPKRTARSLLIGGVSSIPSYTCFNYPSSHALSIAAKVAVNQACFTPVFNTYFFGAQALLSGDAPAAAWERVRQTVPVSVANSLKLWPAVTAFSFAYVPLEYRSVFAGVVAVGWQTYLSFLNRQAELREKEKEKEKEQEQEQKQDQDQEGRKIAAATV